MAGAKSVQVVTGAVAVIRLKDGSDRYLYRGATVDPDLYDADSVKHVTGLGLVGKVEIPDTAEAVEDEPYKGVSVADLKVELAKRNEGRADADKVVPVEPGNRPEIVAALVADDEKSSK